MCQCACQVVGRRETPESDSYTTNASAGRLEMISLSTILEFALIPKEPMYTPNTFEINDQNEICGFIRQYSFATLFSWKPEPEVTHLPLLLNETADGLTLTGHLAKANHHWKSADSNEVLVVFQGPHAYISPTWYGEGPAVPTWNYSVVHARGQFKVIDDLAANQQVLQRYVTEFESNHVHSHSRPSPKPWTTDGQSDEFLESLSQAVVSFSIQIESLTAKWKLSQNQTAERQQSVIAGLRARNSSQDVEVAQMMQKTQSVPE